jgi:hypothetical protein
MKFDYEINKIHKETAVCFIQKYHYSPMMPRHNIHPLGYFLDGKLKGVLTLGWGTQPEGTINKMFSGLKTNHYYEIGKMCLSPELNKTDAGSQMLSATIRWMKRNTNCLFLYTLADGMMGKCGYVYQASNFYYGGNYSTQVYQLSNGIKIHPQSKEARKLIEKNEIQDNKDKPFGEFVKRFRLSYEFMEENGIRKIGGNMFRYIYPLNKKAKRLMKLSSNLIWNKTNYPKDKDLVWRDETDNKNKTLIERPVFSFENANHKISGASLESFFI